MFERLGVGAELWRELDAEDPVLLASGVTNEISVRLDLANTAIHDVLAAAEGIDYSYWRMCTALDEAQDSAALHLAYSRGTMPCSRHCCKVPTTEPRPSNGSTVGEQSLSESNVP